MRKHANKLFATAFTTDKKEFEIYVPTYCHLLVKNFKKFSIQDLNVELALTLRVVFMTKGLPYFVYKRLLNSVTVVFPRNDPIVLKNSVDIDLKRYFRDSGSKIPERIQFVVRRQFLSRIVPYTFMSPFELLDIVFSVLIIPLKIQLLSEGFKIEVKFNLMNNESEDEDETTEIAKKLACRSKGSFGYYKLASNRMRVEYTLPRFPSKKLYDFKEGRFYILECIAKKASSKYTEKINHQQQSSLITEVPTSERNLMMSEEKLESWNQAHFHVPMFRLPDVSLFSIFLPIWFLGFFNLSTFFVEETDLANQVQIEATLMLAYVAFIPVIRDEIPPYPQFTLIEILVYIEAVTTFFSSLQAILNNQNQKDVLNSQSNNSFKPTTLFYLAALFTFASMIIPFLMWLAHRLFYLPRHNAGAGTRNSDTVTNNYANWVYVNSNVRQNEKALLNSSLLSEDSQEFASNLQQIRKSYKHYKALCRDKQKQKHKWIKESQRKLRQYKRNKQILKEGIIFDN